MIRGVILDPVTGRPDTLATVEEYRGGVTGQRRQALDRILDNLHKSRLVSGPFEPRGSLSSWEETLVSVVADGVQVLNTTTETVMVLDGTFTIPAYYMQAGRTLKATLFFDTSTVITTPGTVTFRLRWGGVAGTVLALSGAYAPDPTAASTNAAGYIEYYVVCRAHGISATSGSLYTMGRMFVGDVDDATVTTIVANMNMHTIPPTGTAPAVVSSLDFTVSKQLSPTVQFSVATATTQLTNHLAILESLN